MKDKNFYTKYVNLNIDKIPLRVKENTTILQACDSIGISLPRFCYHEFLSIAGNCRMCLVQVEKCLKPLVSCSTPVMKDMKIYTTTPVVKKARENVLEMLLINHPLDCPICDQGSECDLQQNSLNYGNDKTRFFFKKRGLENFIFNPLIKTVMTRCFHCTRCVRYASEIAGTTILGTIGRGKVTEVSTFISKNLISLFSGNISDLCPVGALTTNTNYFGSRKWERTLTNSIDILDGIGSAINVDTVRNEVIRISSSYSSNINKYGISDKIRYSYDSLIKLRLIKIFKKIKDSNTYSTLSWKEALIIIQKKISSLEGFEIGIIYGPFSDLKTMYNARYFINKKGSGNIGTEYDVRKENERKKRRENDYKILNKVSTNTRNIIDFDSSFKLNTDIKGLEKADLCLLIGINPDTEATALTPRLNLMKINNNVDLCFIGIKMHSNLVIDIIGVSINKILKNILEGKHKINTNLIRKYKNPYFIIGSLLSIREDSNILNKRLRKISNILEGFIRNKDIFNIKNENYLITYPRNVRKISKILERFKKDKDIFKYTQDWLSLSIKYCDEVVHHIYPRKIIKIINYSASITGGLELGIIPGKTSVYNDISIFKTKLIYLLNTSMTTTSKIYNEYPLFNTPTKTLCYEGNIDYQNLWNIICLFSFIIVLNGFLNKRKKRKIFLIYNPNRTKLNKKKEDNKNLPRIRKFPQDIYNKDKKISKRSYIYLLFYRYKVKIAPFIIYQGHHLRIEKNKYKPDLILPSTVYTEKNSSAYMNVEGKVQLLEKATFKRSIFIKDDFKILKSLCNFNAFSLMNKTLKFYKNNGKNTEKYHLDYVQDNFENLIKPFYHFYNDIIIKLFIINDFKNAMCYYSTALKIYKMEFKNTIYL